MGGSRISRNVTCRGLPATESTGPFTKTIFPCQIFWSPGLGVSCSLWRWVHTMASLIWKARFMSLWTSYHAVRSVWWLGLESMVKILSMRQHRGLLGHPRIWGPSRKVGGQSTEVSFVMSSCSGSQGSSWVCAIAPASWGWHHWVAQYPSWAPGCWASYLACCFLAWLTSDGWILLVSWLTSL